MKTFRLALSLMLVLLIPEAYGQYHGKPWVIDYNPEQYRLDNQNWSIDLDSQGTVYIGNNKGLIAFDGSNWDHHSLAEEMVVRSLKVAADSLIYTGAYEEFGYWLKDKAGRLSYHSLSDPLSNQVLHNDEIWRIVQHEDKVYFQSFSNIYVYDGNSVEILTPPSTIVVLMKARNRLFIHVVGEGLYEIREGKMEFMEGTQRLARDEIKVMLPYGEDRFLLGAAKSGLYIYDGKKIEPWNIPDAQLIREAEINTGLSLGRMKIIGTLVHGIFILNEEGELLDHIHSGNFLSNNTILALCSDQRGNLWAGLDRGLNYIHLQSPLDFYIHPTRNIGSAYTALLDNNTLYLGTNQGLFRYQYSPSKGFTNPRLIEGSQGQVWDLKKIRGQIICGHTDGTFRVTKEGLEKISQINGGFDMMQITSKTKDYWLQSTYTSLVLYHYKNNRVQFIRTIDGFIEPTPDIESDHLGYFWAAHTQKGLYRFRLNSKMDSVTDLTYFGKNKGFPTERRIRMTKIRNRLVFTTGEGLYTYDDLNDSIIPYNSLNSQLGRFQDSQQIIASRPGHFWFIRNGEVAFYEMENRETQKSFYYDLSRMGLYMISSHPDIIPLKDSLHLICLDKGFAIYDEKTTPSNQPSPTVVIRKATAFSKNNNQKSLPLNPASQEVEVNYSHRNLHFVFSSSSFSIFPHYRYRLTEINPQWSAWSKQSSTNFTRLPHGNYTLMVQSKDILGNTSKTTSYTFSIRPPWYASNVAWAVYMIILAGGAIALRYHFLRRLKKHKEMIQEEEQEKRMREKMLEQQKYMKLKNEKLQSEIAHKSYQLANYTMTLLRKNEHLTNLKEELQKQKKEMGPRFPNYYYRQWLQMIDKGISTEEDWKQFEYHFDQSHEHFIKRLKAAYPSLTQGDLKLCAYLRLNLSSKEIAPLLNISIRGVEVRRYRLRKRLNLDTEENLVEFLLNF